MHIWIMQMGIYEAIGGSKNVGEKRNGSFRSRFFTINSLFFHHL